MTVLTIAVSLTAPALANFFRGRSLDSEARRLLALTRQGQSRAVSEGIPMELWLDATRGAYGLEAEPSYETTDPRAIEFTLDSDMQLQVSILNPTATSAQSPASPTLAAGNHPNLPKVRFLPDGSMSESSPQSFCVMSRDGSAIWLAQTRNRLNYAITNR
jgi:Tfp pilus assembly protein FimT